MPFKRKAPPCQQRTVRYRLLPGGQANAKALARHCGASLYVRNHIIGRNERAYMPIKSLKSQAHRAKEAGDSATAERLLARANALRDEMIEEGRLLYGLGEMGKHFKAMRHNAVLDHLGDSTGWLAECSHDNVLGACKELDLSYKAYFKGNGGLPSLHAKHKVTPSFALYSSSSLTIEQSGSRVHIQAIGGRSKKSPDHWMRISRKGGEPYPGCRAVSGRVKFELDRWFLYVVYDVPDEGMLRQPAANGKTCGIDRNVGQIALDDGTFYRLGDDGRDASIAKLEKRRVKYQRRMARQRRVAKREGRKFHASGRYQANKVRAAKASAQIARIRDQWAHETSRAIANDYQFARLEGLNIDGMRRSAKGTADSPGKNVAQKRGLNRSISGSAWGSLASKLIYKLGEDNVFLVDPKNTSRRCSNCGHTERYNRLRQASFKCVSCGFKLNADTNAAINIRAADSAVPVSVARQRRRRGGHQPAGASQQASPVTDRNSSTSSRAASS